MGVNPMLNKELLLCGSIVTRSYITVGVSPNNENIIGFAKMVSAPFGENHGVVAKYDNYEHEVIQLYNYVSNKNFVFVVRGNALYCKIIRLDTHRTINLTSTGFTDTFKGMINPPFFSKEDVGKDIPIEIHISSRNS